MHGRFAWLISTQSLGQPTGCECLVFGPGICHLAVLVHGGAGRLEGIQPLCHEGTDEASQHIASAADGQFPIAGGVDARCLSGRGDHGARAFENDHAVELIRQVLCRLQALVLDLTGVGFQSRAASSGCGVMTVG